MVQQHELHPDWFNPIQDFLIELLEEREILLEDLSLLTNISIERLSNFIKGELDLEDSEFSKIEEIFDLPNDYFRRMETLQNQRKLNLKS